MKKLILLTLILLSQLLPQNLQQACGDSDIEEAIVIVEKNKIKGEGDSVIDIYKKIISKNSDIDIFRYRLEYNQKKGEEILDEINLLENHIMKLPENVKSKLEVFEKLIKSMKSEAANDAWIDYENALKKRQSTLETRLSLLKKDLAEKQKLIATLKLELVKLEIEALITDSFDETNKTDKEADKREENTVKALGAKERLKNAASQAKLPSNTFS